MEKIELEYHGQGLPVEIMRTGGQTLYIARLSGREPLVINRARDFQGVYFWTSIPEGQLELAEEIGILIDQYLHTHK
jgi:hypothetical protein